MNCPYCNFSQSKVIDSRPTDEGNSIRRRRECEKCKKRFTTYEKVEDTTVMVIKKDSSRQIFDKNKIINGIVKSCEKRPVSLEDVYEVVTYVENYINKNMIREISSTQIGELVMEKLKDIDEISYVRFASVYRQFKDINIFLEEVKKILSEKE